MDILKSRAQADPFNVAATIIFALAIMHTFAAGFFIKLAHKYEHLHDEALRKRGVRDDEHPDGVPEADPVQRPAIGVENKDRAHRGSPPPSASTVDSPRHPC